MSDTPRTDATWKLLTCGDEEWVRSEFARDLERENARLKEALEWALDHAEESAIEERNSPGEFSRRRKEYDGLL